VSLWPTTSGYHLGVKGNYFFPGCQVFSRKLPYRYAPYIHKDNCKNTAIIELVGMARIFGTALASLKRGLASWIAVHNGVQYSCLKESFCRNSHGVPQLLGSVCRSTLSWRAELIPFKKKYNTNPKQNSHMWKSRRNWRHGSIAYSIKTPEKALRLVKTWVTSTLCWYPLEIQQSPNHW
jgi:hypothetical protein